MTSRRFISALLGGILAVSICPMRSVFAQTCPTDPDKLKSMIGELKETFECSGLSLDSCNKYRNGLIGGGLAGSVLAGLALKKQFGISCGSPGVSSRAVEGRTDLIAFLLFGSDSRARQAVCTIPKEKLVKELNTLKGEFTDASKNISSEMRDRMMAQKIPATDLSKIEVTPEDWRRKFTSGLDGLEKEIQKSPASAADKSRVLEAIARERENLRGLQSLKSIPGQVVMSYENIMGYMSSELKDGLSAEAKKGISYWEIRDTVRAEKVAKIPNTAALKAMSEVELELSQLSSKISYESRLDYLKSRGYSSEIAKQLIDIDNSRKSLSWNASHMQRTAYELTSSAKYRGVAAVSAEEVKTVASKNGLRFLDTALYKFREMPGLNGELLATISRAGRAAMAKASAEGGSKLMTMAKFVAPAVPIVAKAATAEVQVAAELILHDSGKRCAQDRQSPYTQQAPVEVNGREVCRAVDERTDKTDEFLFGLTTDEQLKEMRSNPASCDLLVRMHERYAPSQNWKLTCDGSTVQLNGKTARGENQMVRYDGSEGSTDKLEWYSGSFESCAKVSLKDGAFDSAQVFETENGMSGCGSVGSGKAVRSETLLNRRDTSSEKKMVKEFAEWQNSNAYVLTAAMECCNGSADNAMCPKSEGGGSSKNGRVRTSR